MTPLPILLAAVFFGTGHSFSKIVPGAFSSNSRLDVREVPEARSVRAFTSCFAMKFLWLEIR